MKTATKILSMLLLVAMCLSLIGGAAYADEIVIDNNNNEVVSGGNKEANNASNGNSTIVIDDNNNSNVISGSQDVLTVGGIMPMSSAIGNNWEVNGVTYATMGSAVGYTATNGTLTLKADTTLNSETDNKVSIAKSMTIDLGGKTLSLGNTNISIVGCTVTFENGKVSFTGTGRIFVETNATLINSAGIDTDYIIQNGVVDNTSDWVAKIGETKYTDLKTAFQNATSGATIVFNPNLDTVQNMELSGFSASGVTYNLSLASNRLVLTNCNFSGCTLNVYGTDGGSFLNNNGSTFDGTQIYLGTGVDLENAVILSGSAAKLTVNGGTADNVTLNNGATLSMGSGTVKALTASTGATLLVSGGTVESFTTNDDLGSTRGVTGGKWKLASNQLSRLKSVVPDTYEVVGPDASGYYTVQLKGSTGDDTTGDGYTLYGSPYTRNSSGSVYVDFKIASTNGTYYYKPANGTITALSTGYYSISSISNGYNYRLTLKNSFLDGLANGSYTLYRASGTNSDGNTVATSMGTFVVQGTNIPSGTATITPESYTWYSGDGTCYFQVNPGLQLMDGVAYDYYEVIIDGIQIGGDKLTYNGYWRLGVASSLMDSLAVGEHTISVRTTSGVASCTFRVGATLRAVDTDKHVIGSSKSLSFICSGAISRVWVGNSELSNYWSNYYSLSNNGKTITLTADFLNNLTAGNTYTLTVQTTGGDTPSCTFQILTKAQASASPQTGDESSLALWAAVLILSGSAMVAVLPKVKKMRSK